jgi:YD repeat-containing protein
MSSSTVPSTFSPPTRCGSVCGPPGGGDGGGGTGGTCSACCCPDVAPCPPPPDSSFSSNPVRYANGEVRFITTDLSSDGFGVPWGHTRSYSNRLTVQNTGVNGNSWFVAQLPQLAQPDSSTFCLIGIVQEALWFDLISGSWVARFFVKDTLIHDTTDHVLIYTDVQTGRVIKFFDFTNHHVAAKRGEFKSFTDPAGNETVAAYGGDDRIASFVMQSGGNSAGYHYAYHATGDNAGRLEYATLQVNGAGVRRAKYDYYVNTDNYGSGGDLKRVTIQELKLNTWESISKTLYRYYKSADPNGFAHGLKLVLGPQGYARMEAAGITPEHAWPDQILPYSDNYFEYDAATKAVTAEKVGGAQLSFLFGRSNSAHSDGFNRWKTKTTETLTDGTQNIVYTNYVTQPILKIYKAGANEWYEYFKYDDAGRLVLKGTSAAVQSYTESDPGLVTLKSSDGLIYGYDFYTATDLPDGELAGYIQYEKLKKGSSGTEIKLREWKYTSETAGDSTANRVSEEIVYQSDTSGGSDPATTTYAYDFFSGSVQVEQKTTTFPVVSSGQNGSGTAAVQEEIFDAFGRNTWLKNERGFLTRKKYDLATGAVLQVIEDVDTSEITDAPAVPSGWSTPADGGLHLITDYTVDARGRVTEELGPVHEIDVSGTAREIRRARWIVYKDEERQQWEGAGYRRVDNSADTLINPVTVRIFDNAGRPTDEVSATRASTSDKLLPTDSFPQSTWVRWTFFAYETQRQLLLQRVYHSIPATGIGAEGTNFHETRFGYDQMKRQIRAKTPTGTITRLVYHPMGWVLEKWIGTNDSGATYTNPAGSGTGGNNMKKVEALLYDGGNAGGNGELTQVTQYAGASDTRVTAHAYDFRNRRTATDGEIDFYESYAYDNLDRMTRTERRNTSSGGALGWIMVNKFDPRGRLYQTVRQGTGGSGGNSLEDNSWYDEAGNMTRKQPPGSQAFQLMAYDGVNRVTVRYLAFGPGDVDSDTVMQQEEMTYDQASNVILQVTRERYHDAEGTGPLGDPETEPLARVSYVASYPDSLGRIVSVANYGTNDGTIIDPANRPPACPARSDDVLVTTTAYNDRGEAFQVTDPQGTVKEATFDAAGRLTKTIENLRANETGADKNKTTEYTYNGDNNLVSLTALNSTTGNQVTTYVYGVTGTEIVSNALLKAVIYPDSTSGTDQVEYGYNRLGERLKLTDQRGVVHDYEYDKLGRLSEDRVTLPDSSVDGSILRVSRTYEFRGMLASITGYNAATGGSAVHKVAFTYNEFAQLENEQQAHNGTVDGTTPAVQYDYVDGAGNTIRPTRITYPSTRELNFNYEDPEP